MLNSTPNCKIIVISVFLLFLSTFISAQTQTPEPTPTPTPTYYVDSSINGPPAIFLDKTAAGITKIERGEISTTASPVIDDVLRQTVGFSLFRRSNSRNANPTTQGASFRGIGSSGASRSLVLLEGVPLNDSFGGWILWNRVPSIAIENIEVARGGSSNLYESNHTGRVLGLSGDNGLSGAVNIIPRKAYEKFVFSAEAFGGMQKTFSGSVFLGSKIKNWTFDTVASNFQTRGYKIIDETERGLVDQFSGSRNSNFSGRIEYSFNNILSKVFIKPSYFGEVRSNGTGLQTNRTHLRQIVIGGYREFNWQYSKISWLLYGGNQVYDQTFSTVAINRNSETLNRIQRVPSQNIGFSGKLSTVVNRNFLLFGFSAKEVRGASNEIAVSQNQATSLIGSGGRERNYSVYFQDAFRFNKLTLVGNIRFDNWQNRRALNATTSLSTNQTVTSIFPNRSQNTLSPQFSVLYSLPKNFGLFGSVSRSFRAPSLNEFYRSFRVGNVLTLANENLKPEISTNFEVGVNYANTPRISLRSVFFWTNVSNPVSNVTLSQTPNLITRQRQNVGQTNSRGLEIENETRWKSFVFSVGYLLADAKVVSFPANPSLENRLIPQMSRHQFTFQTRFNYKDWSFAWQGRAASKQFDDDLNTLELEPYFQLDAFAAKRFKENLQIFLGLENILNSQYSVGKTPIRTVNSPFNLRVGIRWK